MSRGRGSERDVDPREIERTLDQIERLQKEFRDEAREVSGDHLVTQAKRAIRHREKVARVVKRSPDPEAVLAAMRRRQEELNRETAQTTALAGMPQIKGAGQGGKKPAGPPKPNDDE